MPIIKRSPLGITSESDPLSLKIEGSNSPTADISWDDNDLNDVEKLSIGNTAPGSHSFLWLENTNLDQHPNIDVVSVQANRQPGLRFRVTDLETPGYAIGGIRGFWEGNQVARVDLVRSDDADAEGPNQNKNEGYISFSVKKEGVARAIVLKLDETGSLEFQDESNYDTDLKWAGSGQLLASDNTFTAPPISFAADPNTGFTNPAADRIGFITNGQSRMTLDATDLNLNVPLVVQTGNNIEAQGGQIWSEQDTETQAASATHTIDWNDGNSTEWDLEAATGDVTLTLSNPQAGASYIIKIIQGSTARNITWPGNVKWPGGTAPTISTTNDAIDIVSLYYDGTNYLGTFNQDFS